MPNAITTIKWTFGHALYAYETINSVLIIYCWFLLYSIGSLSLIIDSAKGMTLFKGASLVSAIVNVSLQMSSCSLASLDIIFLNRILSTINDITMTELQLQQTNDNFGNDKINFMLLHHLFICYSIGFFLTYNWFCHNGMGLFQFCFPCFSCS